MKLVEYEFEQSESTQSAAHRADAVVGIPTGMPTLVHYGRLRAQDANSSAPVFTHVIGQPGEHDRLTFADLDRKARAIASLIQSRGGRGKTVLVVLEPGTDYAAALYGCMYAGAIAVPVYPPQMLRLQHTLSRLKAIVANAGAELMLGQRSSIGDAPSSLWSVADDAAIIVDEIDMQMADGWDGKMPNSDDVAILQYTSGSTGNPRGVVLKHHTILSNLNALVKHFHFAGVRTVQWIPPYHDMGLVGGILVPLYCGTEGILLTPSDFVRDPSLWLRSIDHYNGTSNGAPNFGYELCIRKIKHEDCEGLDLSSWKVAIAGAEPVRASTLNRFYEKFKRYNFEPTSFCPAFGMAESTLIVTGSRLGEHYKTFRVDSDALHAGKIVQVDTSANSKLGDYKDLVGSGVAVTGLEVEIVDPQTRCVVSPGEVGEIWIRGTSVADGYWNAPEKTAATFHASIIGTGRDDYLRTGDLGAKIGHELIVTGRLKELIIVAGKNLYPHDVEQIVQSTSAAFRADTGVAFGFDTPEGEELVVIQEVLRPKKYDTQELLHDAVAAIASEFSVTPHAVVLVRTGTLPKTSSGKLQRGDARKLFVEDNLPEIARWTAEGSCIAEPHDYEPPATEIEQKVAEIWASVLGVKQVGRHDDFFYLGGGSLLVAQMLSNVDAKLGVYLPLASLFHNSTLSSFAKAVEESTNGSSDCVDGRNSLQRANPNQDGTFPLSSAQQRFWLLSQLEQTNAFLHVPVSIEIDGVIEGKELEVAFHNVIALHPSLRTVFFQDDGAVAQVIHNRAEFQVEERTLQASESIDQWRTEFVSRPFDLDSPPLMRAALIRTTDGTFIELVFHHIVCDASSIEVVIRDLQDSIGDSIPDPSLAYKNCIRYVDFAAWEQVEQSKPAMEPKIDYWRRRLADAPTTLAIPRCTESSEQPTSAIHRSIAPKTTEVIRQRALTIGVTESMVYLTAFQSVLSRYAATSDIPIALPTSIREHASLSDCVGCFINPIVYRANVDAQQALPSALLCTRDHLLSDLDHAEVPFQTVVENTVSDRSIERMPLAQVMFLYQPSLNSISNLGSARVRSIQPDYSLVTAYDLSLVVHPSGKDDESPTQVTLVSGQGIDPAFSVRLMQSLERTIDFLASENACKCKISDLPILSSVEQDFLETTSCGPELDFANESIVSKIQHHAKEHSSTVAIQHDNGVMTYGELESASNRIANALVRKNVQRNELIGIRLPRNQHLIPAIIGIWKAGGAYVPLDEKLPETRLNDIISDAGIERVVDSMSIKTLLESDDYGTENDLDSLAYVIYTSGSTGKPKGVAIEHSSVSNLLTSFADKPGFDQESSMLAVTTIAFDISVLEMFLPLWCGGQVQLTAARIAEDPDAVIQRIADCAPTHIQSTPSAFRMLLHAGWRPERDQVILCGGEPLLPDVAEDLLSTGCELWNVYGPTETTVWSAIEKIESSKDITIGSPIANTRLVLMDDAFQPAPQGVAAELCIGGDGLAASYWNNDALTQQKFVSVNGQRFYRTGDQGVRRPDGKIDFLARTDRQVKLNGFRVELDEVECCLQKHPSVKRSAVVVRESDAGTKSLIGFCEVDRDCKTNANELIDSIRTFSEGVLPDYMVPIVRLVEDLPTTNAGKTDYRALPQSCAIEQVGQPPATPIEDKLAQLWSEVLGIENINREDNFFDLGGNSLMAAQLFARLRERLDLNLPLREIYQHPTITSLSERIIVWQSVNQPSEFSELLDQLEALSEEDAERALDH